MKRFLASFAVITALVGFVGVSPAFAATTPTNTGETDYTITATAGTGGTITPNGQVHVKAGQSSQVFKFQPNSGYGINSVVVDGKAQATPGTSYQFSNVTTNHQITVTFSTNSKLGANATGQNVDLGPTMTQGMNSVMVWIASLFAWLLGASMIILDYSTYYTVISMGAFVNNLGAIDLTWRILRDLGNIMLIFGFLVAGISVILDVNLYGWSKKMIPMLLVAAVFLNFSLFISEAIIDVGNLFATEFYVQINGGNMPTTVTSSTAVGTQFLTAGHEAISSAIMDNLGLQTIYGDARTQNEDLAANHPFFVGFSSIILFILASFVILTLAFILIARFVSLIYYIIMSPLGFAGLAIPHMSGVAGRWWRGIFEQTITAPILFLLLYVALRVITATNFLTGLGLGPENAAGAATGFIGDKNLVGYGGFLLSFLVAMGLLLGVVYAAKKLGAHGVDLASRAAGRLSFGTVSLAGRATLGGIGLGLSSRRMQAWATNEKGNPILARRLLTFTGKRLANRTYDMRNFGASKGLGMLGINAGKGATMTASKFASNIDLSQQGRLGLNKIKPVREWFEASDVEHGESKDIASAREAKAAINKAKADLAAGKITEAAYKDRVAPHEETLQKATAKASPQRLVALAGESGGEIIAEHMSPQRFVKFMESDSKEVSAKKKEEMRTARFRKFNETFAAATKENATEAEKSAALDAINALNDKELAFIEPETLKNEFFVDALSSKKFVAAMENVDSKTIKGEMRQARFRKVRTAITEAENTEQSATATPEQKRDAREKAREVARGEFKRHGEEETQYMDKKILLSAVGAQSLPEDQFIALQKKNILNAIDTENMNDMRKQRFIVDETGKNGISAAEVADEITNLKWNPEKINKQVPAAAFENPEVLNALDPRSVLNLVSLAGSGKLDIPASSMKEIGKFIESASADKSEGNSERARLLASYLSGDPARKAAFGLNGSTEAHTETKIDTGSSLSDALKKGGRGPYQS